MNKTQLQRKKGRLHTFLIALVYFFLCGTLSSYATIYRDGDNNVVGTSDSRLVATIIETDTSVTLQVIAIGEMIFDGAEYAFFIKHGEFVLSDKTFTKELSYGAYNSNPSMFTDNIDLGVDLLKYGAQNLEFKISAKTSYREPGEGLQSTYSSVNGMDALVVAIFDDKTGNRFAQSEGEINTIFTCYFKKLTPGRPLVPTDLGIGAKITYTGGRFCPKWMHAGFNLTYTTIEITSEAVVPELFSYRTPSSVTTDNVDQININSATLYGSLNRGNLPPTNDLLEGWIYQSSPDNYELQYEGRLNCDRVTQRGFIYVADKTVSMSIKEYSDTLIINGEKYLFPNSSEVAAGQFSRGGYTFYIVTEPNSAASASYNTTLNGLEPKTDYSAWAYIKYDHETSREYSKIGDPIRFRTYDDCQDPSLPVVSDQSFCGGAKVSDLKASVSADSELRWYDVPVGGDSLLGNTPLTNGTYYARAIVSTCSSASAEVQVTINTGLASPSATTPQSFCDGTVSDLKASGSNIEWYTTPSGGSALNPSDKLSDGIYYASQSSDGCQSTSRTAVQVNIGNIIPNAPFIGSPQNFCEEVTLADIATDGSSLNWYNENNELLDINTQLTYGSTYYAAQTAGECESAARTAVQILSGEPVVPDVTTPSPFCEGATLANITVPNDHILWYSELTDGFLLDGSTVLSDGATYYAAQQSGACESERVPVTVTISTLSTPVALVSQVFCSQAIVANLSVTGTGIKWYDVAEGGDPLEITTSLKTATYYAAQSSGDCESDRLAINVTILELGLTAPLAQTPQTFCESATVSNLQATGNNIKWYDTKGDLLSGDVLLTNGAVYYAAQSTSLCESAGRTAVQVIIDNTTLDAPDISGPQSFCNPATLADVATNGNSNIVWYATLDGKAQLPLNTILAEGTYYAAFQAGNCQNSLRSAVEIVIIDTVPSLPEFTTEQLNQRFCQGATVADISAPNNQIVWYSSEGATISLAKTTLLQSGKYYAAQSAGTCQSSGRQEVTIIVSDTVKLLAPIAPANQIICGGGIIASLKATGSGIVWYESSTGGDALLLDTELEDGKTYYAMQSAGSCESTTRTAVKVITTSTVTISEEPSSQHICPGDGSEEITFSVVSEDALDYQWYKDGEPISGATSSTLTILAEASSLTNYYVVVSSECASLKSDSVFVLEKLNIIAQKRGHTLVVDNNPKFNGELSFAYYKWYKNGKELYPGKRAGGVDKGGYYYTGGSNLNPNDEYYAEMWDKEGNYYITCPFNPSLVVDRTISVYPNPLVSSQVVYVDANVDEETLENATIEIYGSLGSYIGNVKAQRLTPVRLPEEKGVYILKFRSAEMEENFKIIVK